MTGANYIARRAGFKDIVTFDMGGTSLDAAVVLDGEPYLTSETTIDFGIVLKIPMIQITTIGAGGGSIASIDRGGFLQIGPESAGADPGPVAYGRGGKRVTVTDANVVLGRINSDRPIGSAARRFDVEGAQQALLEQVGKPLGLSAHDAAEAVITVANTRMAGTVRLATVEKGHDPRRFTLVGFGGAGPLHAGAVMREVRIARTLVPYFPGVISALGCAVGNVQYDFIRTLNRRLDADSTASLSSIWDEQAREGAQVLAAGKHFTTETRTVCSADMQFEGQTHALLVNFGERPASLQAIREIFHARYRQNFGIALDLPITISNVRTSVIGVRRSFDFSGLRELVKNSGQPPLLGHRPVYFGGKFVQTAIYERSRMAPGMRIEGPAVVEQADTTVLVEPGLVAQVDDDLNLIMQVQL